MSLGKTAAGYPEILFALQLDCEDSYDEQDGMSTEASQVLNMTMF